MFWYKYCLIQGEFILYFYSTTFFLLNNIPRVSLQFNADRSNSFSVVAVWSSEAWMCYNFFIPVSCWCFQLFITINNETINILILSFLCVNIFISQYKFVKMNLLGENVCVCFISIYNLCVCYTTWQSSPEYHDNSPLNTKLKNKIIFLHKHNAIITITIINTIIIL